MCSSDLQSQSVLVGGTATFNVTATGGGVLSYQWLFNRTNLTDAGNILGSLTTILTITNAQLTNAGGYSVTVSNAVGSLTSANATLTVVQPPSFQAVTLNGATINFTWTAIAGRKYQVQYSADLTTGNWTNSGGVITATGNSSSSSDVIGGSAQQFYRIILLPY